MFGLNKEKFIVAPPQKKRVEVVPENIGKDVFTFFYASTPDCHKNFETLCQAARLLEAELGKGKFRVVLTINGSENRYSRWLYELSKGVKSIDFAGFMTKEKLYGYYKTSDCFVFPSKVETWGLPITEFMETSGGKPMILADLPYAHETSAGASKVCFFNPTDPAELKDMMKELIDGNARFEAVPEQKIEDPKAYSWEDLFKILLG